MVNELKFEANIIKVGNSLGVTIPKAIIANLGVIDNKKFMVTIKEA